MNTPSDGRINTDVSLTGDREVHQWGDLFLFPVETGPDAMGSERHILLTKGLTRVIGVVADLDKKKGRWTIRFLGLFGEQTQEVNIDSNEEMSRTLASISAMWKLANPHLR